MESVIFGVSPIKKNPLQYATDASLRNLKILSIISKIKASTCVKVLAF